MSRIATEQPRAVWCCSTCGAIYHRDFPRCPADGAEVIMAARDPLLDTTVGNYVIERLVGEGGMGRVYLAHHANLPNKRYAFKVLLGDHAASTAMRTRFTREAERASQLDHPNVVKVVDFGQTQHGLLYIVMDYVDGPPLVTLIGELPMAVPRVVQLAREICKGLAYAHDAGIVHRDLKPENILVAAGPDGPVARIVDFGLALSIDQRDARLTESGMTMGTPLFAAPEQLLGKAIDHRADLYALGMTMFEMLTGGMTPVPGHAMEVVAAKTARDTPRLSERAPELAIPAELDDIVARLTRRKPADRYASAREVIDALDRVPLSGPARGGGQLWQAQTGEPVREAPVRREMLLPTADPAPAGLPEARIPTQMIHLPHRGSARWLAAVAIAAAAMAAVVLVIARAPERPSSAPVEPILAAPLVGVPAPSRVVAQVPVAVTSEADGIELEPADPPPVRPRPRPPVVERRAPRPAMSPPRRELRAEIAVDVSGSLPAGAVQRAVERKRSAIESCVPSEPATVVARFTIGETRRAQGVRTAGAPAPTSACIMAAVGGVRTEAAPDVGDVEVTLRIAFVEKT